MSKFFITCIGVFAILASFTLQADKSLSTQEKLPDQQLLLSSVFDTEEEEEDDEEEDELKNSFLA